MCSSMGALHIVQYYGRYFLRPHPAVVNRGARRSRPRAARRPAGKKTADRMTTCVDSRGDQTVAVQFLRHSTTHDVVPWSPSSFSMHLQSIRVSTGLSVPVHSAPDLRRVVTPDAHRPVPRRPRSLVGRPHPRSSTRRRAARPSIGAVKCFEEYVSPKVGKHLQKI